MKKYLYSYQRSSSGLRLFKYVATSHLDRVIKILTLSDLHIFSKNDMANMDMIVEEMKNEKYDAVFLIGDIIDQTAVLRDNEVMTNRLLQFIAHLGSVAPTYIVYGNHDFCFYSSNYKKYFGVPWLDGYSTLKEQLHDKIVNFNGIHILDNNTEYFDEGLTISGINPTLDYIIEDAKGSLEGIANQIDLSFLEKLNPHEENILLCHYPNIIFELHKRGMLKSVDLCGSGHNHNGCTQLKVFPVEDIFDLFGMKGRGFVTPTMSFNLEETKNLRGIVELDGRTNLLINPSIKTFSATNHKLERLDALFYKGATSIELVPKRDFVLRMKK